ncbi:MAG: hypothetical protein H0W75_03165 [Chitinophagaceae bacterium]|nr:hypothetical protein [Chitinophagaceae bacterium]
MEFFFKKIIEKLKEENIEIVDIASDEYLLISTDEWENFEQDVEPIIGSLEDDSYRLLNTKKGDVPFTYVDFDRVASLLRAISQEINPP